MIRISRAIGAVLLAILLLAITAGGALAHESRQVGEYTFVVGFLDEPVYAGSKSGLDLRISRGPEASPEPVSEQAQSIDAEVWYQTDEANKRVLEISEAFSSPGSYRSFFYPTAAGQYTFRVFGTIDGFQFDERFTSGPETFNQVQDTREAQFPQQFPNQAELATQASAGNEASRTLPIALGLGGGGLLLGLIALGVSLANRRRTA